MATIKRLYLYAASAVGLLVLSVGLYNLGALILGELADALGAGIIAGALGSDRQQVSLAIALTVIGLPIFAIHWLLIGRAWRGTDEAGLDDRRSPIRAFHLGLMATVALAVAAFAVHQTVDQLLTSVFGGDRFSDSPPLSDAVAMLIVAIPVWWYHARRRNADLRHDRLTGAAAWITRLYRYGWTFAGLILMVVGASQVIETLASMLIGPPDLGSESGWWMRSLAGSLAALAVGSGLFLIHADDARQVIREAVLIGEDDRASRVRAVYFGAVMLTALTSVGVVVARSLASLAQALLGATGDPIVPVSFELVVGPLLGAAPFAVAGWLHWQALRREGADRSPADLDASERWATYLAAGVGLAFLAVGVGQLLGRLLEVALGVAPTDVFLRDEVTWLVPQVVVGAVIWIPTWAAVLRRRASNPSTERRATVGRAYLYLVVAAALMGGVPSAALLLYNLIDALLGGAGFALASQLAIPIAVLLVASIIGLYHGRLLVSDIRLAAPSVEPAEAAPAGGSSGPPVPAMSSMTLTLQAPSGTDLESVVVALREHLPSGVRLNQP